MGGLFYSPGNHLVKRPRRTDRWQFAPTAMLASRRIGAALDADALGSARVGTCWVSSPARRSASCS